ncbi:hypothetical protein ACH44C_33890 [Streptomyces purpureus]|uniref:hypothetical protein n=1 Tax=Streptomyces purpureus TaxID=1951 RepID=UPI0037B16C83
MTTHHTRPLAFTGPAVQASVVRHAKNYLIGPEAIVINPTPTPVPLAHTPAKAIEPLTSTVLTHTRIEHADTLLVLRPATGLDAHPTDAITRETGWQHLTDRLTDQGNPNAFPATTPLFTSPQDTAATIHLDPAHLLKETPIPTDIRPFDLKVNLWYAPAGTDCLIHNSHDFIEVHTQIQGLGRMQKFTADDPATRYEDIRMAPGYTTPDPFCSTRPDGTYHYPWHQYYADTDALWLALEFHAR